jgi:hypothetical protein
LAGQLHHSSGGPFVSFRIGVSAPGRKDDSEIRRVRWTT